MRIRARTELIWLWHESRPYAVNHGVTIGSMLAAGLLIAAEPLLMRYLIDDVLPTGRIGALVTVTGVMLLAFVFRWLLWSVSATSSAVAVSRMTSWTRRRLISQLLSQSSAFHARHSVG